MQNYSIPLSIVIAGALIAGAVFYTSGGGGGSQAPAQGEVLKKVRTITKDDHVRGSEDAKVVIVEYSDPECPFCKQFHTTLQRVMSDYEASGDVAWVYRHFPLEQLHPKAPEEAEALECAADQGGNDMFWQFTDMVYETTNSNNSLDIGVYNTPSPTPTGPDGKPYYTEKVPRSTTDAGELSDIASSLGLDVSAFEECLASDKYAERVSTDMNEAFEAGGQGTPHSIMIVGRQQTAIEGAQSFEAVKQRIEEAL